MTSSPRRASLNESILSTVTAIVVSDARRSRSTRRFDDPYRLDDRPRIAAAAGGGHPAANTASHPCARSTRRCASGCARSPCRLHPGWRTRPHGSDDGAFAPSPRGIGPVRSQPIAIGWPCSAFRCRRRPMHGRCDATIRGSSLVTATTGYRCFTMPRGPSWRSHRAQRRRMTGAPSSICAGGAAD